MSELTKSRFLSIDALRGIAAFLVVIYHVFGGAQMFSERLAVPALVSTNYLYFVPAFGYAGVYLFFVISGFCIHLRWTKARAKDQLNDPKIDFFAFWKRRWIRLYPAYLAALVIFIAWEYYEGIVVFNWFFLWDMISHVLMIHNLDNHTVYSMNGVFWTLAIEEQLYLLYFLLLYLRTKLGWSIVLGITGGSRLVWLAVSLFVTKKLGFELPFNEGALANWWIWAMGALAVESYYGVMKFQGWYYSRTLTVVLLASAGSMHYLGFSTPATPMFVNIAFVLEPFLWGAGFFLLINYATSVEGHWKSDGIKYKTIAVAALLGLFSYSLYLTHEVVIQSMAGMNRYLICLFCLVFAYAFFLIFEKPFMLYLSRRRQN